MVINAPDPRTERIVTQRRIRHQISVVDLLSFTAIAAVTFTVWAHLGQIVVWVTLALLLEWCNSRGLIAPLQAGTARHAILWAAGVIMCIAMFIPAESDFHSITAVVIWHLLSQDIWTFIDIAAEGPVRIRIGELGGWPNQMMSMVAVYFAVCITAAFPLLLWRHNLVCHKWIHVLVAVTVIGAWMFLETHRYMAFGSYVWCASLSMANSTSQGSNAAVVMCCAYLLAYSATS